MSKPVIFNRATQQPPKAGPWRSVANMFSDIRGRLGSLEQRPLVRDGRDGTAGRDGIDGNGGAPGLNGADGRDGKDGVAGLGRDGVDGINGKDGLPGKDADQAMLDAIGTRIDSLESRLMASLSDFEFLDRINSILANNPNHDPHTGEFSEGGGGNSPATLNTAADVAAAATGNQSTLADAATKIGAENGTAFINPGVKSLDGIERKMATGRTAASITDAVRGGFQVDTPQQSDKIVSALSNSFATIHDEGWQKTPAGYLDRKVIVTFPNGQRDEVQLWAPGMLHAKESSGTALYTEWRSLPASSPRATGLLQKMSDLYGGVTSKLPHEWKAVAGKSGK